LPSGGPSTSASLASAPPSGPATQDDKARGNKTRHHVLAANAASGSSPSPSLSPSPSPSGPAAPAFSAASTSPAGPAAPAGPPAVAAVRASEPAADAPATLAVAIAPWCDLTVDGKSHGRTPQTLTLPPGQHHLECKNPVSGQALVRDLQLAPGAHDSLRERLYATVRVTAQLSRGDALSIDGDPPGAGPRQVAPGRRRVTLFAAGSEVETRYVDVPPAGCRIVDKPELHCDKP
jgi:hypothetical protein